DGTLIGEGRPIGPRTRAAIARALAAGVHVAIATGRMPTSAAVYATELGLTLPVLAYQGALVPQMPEPGRRLGRILSPPPTPALATIRHPRFLAFIPGGVSKGRAVRWLARRLGVRLGQTMAIGDQHNDLEMIAAVGHGVAMPTAPAEVLAVARHIAPPLDEEG